jgi:predicted RND superfamily exporter protein
LKSIVSFLAVVSQRIPWVVVAVTLVLTGVLGALAGQIEPATGNEGFAPEGEEISASERIGEKFGSEVSESTVQIVMRDDGGDVITLEGLRVATEVVQVVMGSDVGGNIADRPERPGIFHYLSGVEGAMAAQGLTIDQMTDEMVKQFYVASLEGSPPEQASFLTRLVSSDFEESTVSASSGMALAFVTAFEGADPEDSFVKQGEAEVAMAEDLEEIDTDLEVRPFSLSLLFSGADDITAEVGQLFGMAFLVILFILLFVYWLKPGAEGGRWASIRRTVTDMLLTLLTIVMAIGWMQGIGYLLLEVGVLDAFSSIAQIVPILLIGLGVDYAIHLTSSYREQVGSGESVDGAMSKSVKTVGIALALATVTTVIGFLTNVFNPVPALKDFGILASVGIVVSFVLMLTFVPAVRRLADRRAEAHGTLPVSSLQSHGERVLPRIMEKLAILAEHAAIPAIIIAIVLGGAGFYAFTQLDTKFSFTDFLPDDSPYVETTEIIADEFGGGFGEQTQVLVEATDERGIADGEMYNLLVDANADLAEIEDVSTIETPEGNFANALSPVAVLNQMLQGGPTSAPPEILAAVQQVGMGPDGKVSPDADMTPLLQALLTVAPEQAARVIYFEGGEVDALLWDITTTAGENVSDLRVGLDTAFQPVNDASASAIDTSNNIISDVVVTSLTESQTQSLFITIAVAGLVLVINFVIESRRWFLGVITIAPVALVVLWTYGLMFLSGISFNPVTATLSALAIGIGVPFTIHIARRFQDDRRKYEDMDTAMRSTMKHTGGALAGSAFTTMAGFGILMTSSLVPFRQMGQITVYAIGLALAASVLVLPSMLALWDGYHRRRGDDTIGSSMVD